jgi:hypothetical protein
LNPISCGLVERTANVVVPYICASASHPLISAFDTLRLGKFDAFHFIAINLPRVEHSEGSHHRDGGIFASLPVLHLQGFKEHNGGALFALTNLRPD